ncbi:MAG: F0F1 ATP synthase subunit delta [Candidatus Babeliales bacterium]
MNNQQKLARLYAQAYMGVYGHTLDRTHIATLELLARLFIDDTRARALIKFPHAAALQQQWFTRLAKQCAVESWLAIVMLLMQHARLQLLGLVTHSIVTLYYQKHDMLRCTIETACPVLSQEYETIAHFFEKMAGKEIIYTTKVDTALIAGVRISSSTVLWEDSIRKRLNDCAKMVRKGYA